MAQIALRGQLARTSANKTPKNRFRSSSLLEEVVSDWAHTHFYTPIQGLDDRLRIG